MEKNNKNRRRAIQTLLTTVALILSLNFACAQGAGVQILNLLGQVPVEEISERSQILRGVDFMQTLIKTIAASGLLVTVYFALKHFRLNAVTRTNHPE